MRRRFASAALAALTLLGGLFVPSDRARADEAADLRKLKQEIEAERAAIAKEDGNAADDSRVQFSVKYDFSGQMARRLP